MDIQLGVICVDIFDFVDLVMYIVMNSLNNLLPYIGQRNFDAKVGEIPNMEYMP